MVRILGKALAAFVALTALSGTVGVAAQEIEGPKSAGRQPTDGGGPPRAVDGVSSFKLGSHQDWTSSGLRVKQGEQIKVRAWGRARIGALGGQLIDPNGSPAAQSPRLLDGAAAHELIAVIGDDNNDYIAIGKDADFRAAHAGVIYFTLNQLGSTGNDGEFDVRVSLGTASGLTFGQNPGLGIGIPANPDPRGVPVASSDGAKSVEVSPKLDWTNTYISVERGDTIVIEAIGSVGLDLAGHACGPDGMQLKDPGRLITDKPTGSLIAVIGVDNNDFLYVGARSRIVAARTGLLFLGINEEDLTNNSGAFTARVVIEKRAK